MQKLGDSIQRKIIRLMLRKPDASVDDIGKMLYIQGLPARVSTIKTVRRITQLVLDEITQKSSSDQGRGTKVTAPTRVGIR